MTAGMALAARSDPLVSARGIGVRLGERWIIRHVDLQVLRGELVYVIGANGAGKSTCAKAVLGLIAIDEGKVERVPAAAVGYVPQRLSISPTLPLTLRRLMTLTGRYSRREIDAALAAVGLEKLGNPPTATLSGGEFQRLLLARALIDRPGPAGPRRAGPGGRRQRDGGLPRADRGDPPHHRLRHPDRLPRHRAGGEDRRRCGRPGAPRA